MTYKLVNTIKKRDPQLEGGTNITVRIEELTKDHKLDNGDLFILAYNQVFEGCFYKGNSNSQKMNGLVLRVVLVEMTTGCILHVIHVATTSMKIVGI